MAWNGWKVIDMDSHIQEQPARMYNGYVDKEYEEDFQRLKKAIEANIQSGGKGAVAASRYAILAPVVSDGTLGMMDSFGMAPREFILQPKKGTRTNFGRPERGDLPMIRPEVNWDVKARIEDMDASYVDVDVLYPTHVSSYCALNDVGFENALYRAYHRWVSDFCSQAPARLKWTLVANMRDSRSAVQEIKYWAKKDINLVGVYFSPQGPNDMLLDDKSLHPIYAAAQEEELPILVHGGTARPPYAPGTFDLRGAWFLQHSLGNPWAGMASMGALIGGGIFEKFPSLRAAVVETAAGWLPGILDRYDSHYALSPAHVPYLKHTPSQVVKESGRYFHGIDTWEKTLEWLVGELGEDVLVFATDWPHGDTAWPEAVQQVVEWKGLSDSAKRKILGENALKLCPRLQG
ncbi:MAG: amidohydrolase [SAR202 cluster bacterium]|nr:amidohydrolase [SAR202 cluster bacterium]